VTKKTQEKVKPKVTEKSDAVDAYSCLCGYKTDSLSDFTHHLTSMGKKEKGKHKSMGTKPKNPRDVHTGRPKGAKAQQERPQKKTQKETEGIVGRIEEAEFIPPVPATSPTPPLEAVAPPEPEPEDLQPEAEETRQVTIPIQRGGDGSYRALIPEEVVGRGIPFKVTLSVRTIAYFQIASSINPGLTIGDFIDQCVHDTFEGRGLSLGLIKLEG